MCVRALLISGLHFSLSMHIKLSDGMAFLSSLSFCINRLLDGREWRVLSMGNLCRSHGVVIETPDDQANLSFMVDATAFV